MQDFDLSTAPAHRPTTRAECVALIKRMNMVADKLVEQFTGIFQACAAGSGQPRGDAARV
ncbi:MULTISPECIES: hypothetical protein [unclassified Variovorax]|uniref:hypothetical protein n=1 Tax=unclassified Variovorax TaxID=663243 RepID=UPI00076C92BD|nr:MULTISPECIES: hypothetical protein [unclassified Variovorax]KWT98270.1 hypothetical protein APY03_0405 [Variovorax sp. WDL1]PNG50076.1 hypothetical protein CHC06_05674 [Variovorax sp. B2]PNG50948.1 hypothetical protein CHC07_05579 [Variovorax sp. B4]VTU41703.1 hypothetical protein SRS16P1_00087 [Variovorax sp. SRS16]VTU41743.1 hypothetical protein E5P1_00087 [Variovorax sp. PBL-E5]